MFDLNSKVALVTGSGQGIGKGIAQELANAGATVIIADLNPDNAHAVAAEITDLGKTAMPLRFDVTDTISVKKGLAEAFNRFPRIDILVNNAGVFQRGQGLDDISLDDFDCCYEVNLKGMWRVTSELIPHFKARCEGKIVNIASVAGRVGIGPIAYSASKAAVISLTQSLANTLGPDNINVNAVCPGIIWTPMMAQISGITASTKGQDEIEQRAFFTELLKSVPLKRQQTPEDIGNAVVFFVSERAKNITGQALNVDGGFRMN